MGQTQPTSSRTVPAVDLTIEACGSVRLVGSPFCFGNFVFEILELEFDSFLLSSAQGFLDLGLGHLSPGGSAG